MIVVCEIHGTPYRTVHTMADDCLYPHDAGQPSGSIPSMTAAETLDPREAVHA